MTKICIFFLTIFFFAISSFAQCGNDSVVTTYMRQFNNSGPTIQIQVDSIDLVNGVGYTSSASSSTGIPGPLGPMSAYNFTRHLISYNSNHDTLQYLQLVGNGSGYDNYRKTEFTYTPTFQPLTRTEYYWNGAAWLMSRMESFAYSANLITNYLLSDSSGNILQKNYSYFGSNAVSLIFQSWVGSVWINETRYLFTYNAGIRDSLYYQRWDQTTGLWIDSVNAHYDPSDNYLATLIRSDTSQFVNRAFFSSIDTLNNLRHYIIYDSLFQTHQTWSYNYIHGCLKITGYQELMQGSGGSDNYTYDQYGVLIHYRSSRNGTMNFSHDENRDFDSLYRPILYSYGGSSNVSSYDTKFLYEYADANHINSFQLVPVSGHRCQGDTLALLSVNTGGCGTLHYLWTPAVGLSSDTIATPIITITDSISYIITITDSIGQMETDTLVVIPELHNVISFDTLLCSGCPVVLSINPGFNTYYQWYRNDTLINGATGSSYTATISGNYSVLAHNSYCDYFSQPVTLTLSGLTRITGRIFLDIDSNCTFNSSDRALYTYGTSPYLIKIQRQYYTAFLMPDSNGIFDIPVDTGSFNLSIVNPSLIYTAACPDSGIISVNVPNFGDTISGINLVLKPLYNCQRLSISLSAGIIRPCMPVNVFVHYSNDGTIDENNVYADLTIPPELTNLTSSIPYTVTGNKYHFSLPALPVGSFGSFIIHADIACNPAYLTGATLCIDAEIAPIDFCSLNPDTLWDGSNVKVSAYCYNDSNVCFIIRNDANPGNGNMDTISVWRLFANNVLIQQGTFSLNSGTDTTLCFQSDGRTFRLEADQTSGFPINNFPFASIERCGVLPNGGNYSLGEILQHPPQNILPFYNTYCSIVRSSFDPNSKTVQPTGLYSGTNDRLKYRIDFQNTGNDTAINVKIIDETYNVFDYSSIQLLASSHSYNFQIDGSKFIWQFDSINLPDSNINEPLSHGFVEFSIKPRVGFPMGYVISNMAEIYFDSNPVINTSYTQTIICDIKVPSAAIQPSGIICHSMALTLIVQNEYGGSNPSIVWWKNGVQLSQTNDTISLTGLVNGDIIRVRINSNYPCAQPDTVSSTYTIQFPDPEISYQPPHLQSSLALSYQWFYNGSLLIGDTNQTITPIQNGSFQVQTIDSNGCTSISSIYYFNYTGIKQLTSDFILYPNPANQSITIEGLKEDVHLLLMDMSGKILRSYFAPKFPVSVANLAPGMYFIRIVESNCYLRLIIQHD